VLGDNGEYTMAPHIGLSLTIDHRAVDGAPGARFLKAVKEAIEGFELTLAV
jgi:pyruvate dehydrogenase E2 component (dihydrolipoamide acetyltransferase)